MANNSNSIFEYFLSQFYQVQDQENARAEPAAGVALGLLDSVDYQAMTPMDGFLLCNSGHDLVLGYGGTDYIITSAGDGGSGAGAEALRSWLAHYVEDFTSACPGDEAQDVVHSGVNSTSMSSEERGVNAVPIVGYGVDQDSFKFAAVLAPASDAPHQLETGDRLDLSQYDGNGTASRSDVFTLVSVAPDQEALPHETGDGRVVATGLDDVAAANSSEFHTFGAGSLTPATDDFDF